MGCWSLPLLFFIKASPRSQQACSSKVYVMSCFVTLGTLLYNCSDHHPVDAHFYRLSTRAGQSKCLAFCHALRNDNTVSSAPTRHELGACLCFAAQHSAFAAFKSLPACGSIYFPLYRRAGFIAYDSVKCMPMLSAPMQNMLSAGCALWAFEPPVSLFRNSLIQSDLFGMGKNHFKCPLPRS